MTFKVALWGAAVLLAGTAMGCFMPGGPYSLVKYTLVNQPPRPLVRRTPDSVDVFLGRPPDRPHVDVGLFEARRELADVGYYRQVGDALASLRLHGALRGCDAIAVLDFDQVTRYDGDVVRAVCAMYTDAQAAQTKLAPPPPLPGEGKVCGSTDSTPSIGGSAEPMLVAESGCTDPLMCVNKHCVSPYH
jgi:hypothetical protein